MITAREALHHYSDAEELVVKLFIANEIEPEIKRVYEEDTEINLKVDRFSYLGWRFDKLSSEKYSGYSVDHENVTEAIVKELENNGYSVGYTIDEFGDGHETGTMTISWKPQGEKS